MEFRNLGRSGLRVSVVGLGCNNFGMRIGYEAAEAVVEKCLDEGINLFDTADIYGQGQSEEMLGKALGARRQDVVIATKFAGKMGEDAMHAGASRRWMQQAVEDSLRRLGTDYIDLYQVHFPDPLTPLEETLRALDDLVRAGKVRYVGHSNFASWQIASCHFLAAREHCTPFVSAQNQYSLLQRGLEREILPACREFGVSLLPWGPLASGLLTGKYRQGEAPPEGTRFAAWGPRLAPMLSDKNFATLAKLSGFAETHEHTLLDLAMGWMASKPEVASVIAGATTPEQVALNVAAGAWRLSAAEMAEVDKLVG